MKKITVFALSLLSMGFAIASTGSVLSNTSQSSSQNIQTTQNKNQPIVLNNGIQITTLKEGNGAKPNSTSNVEVHYRGTFKDGREFDSSYKRGETIKFNLGGVIPCWTQGVQYINVGGKAKLFCPSATAYGARGAGSAVPPNTDLYFDIELISIPAN